MGDLFGDYAVGEAWDEMFVAPDVPRAPYVPLHEQLEALTPSDFDDRCDARDRSFRNQGITFSLSGEERPFPLDLVPRIIPADEWRTIEHGVAQRVLALEAFLADVYGRGRIFGPGHRLGADDVSWRIKVRHSSGYCYATPVLASYNEARITPLSTPQQSTIHSLVQVEPRAATFRYWDYWGTLVHAFELHADHEELTVVGTSTVETAMSPPCTGEVTWDELEPVRDRFAEYLEGTSHVPATRRSTSGRTRQGRVRQETRCGRR